MAATQAMQSFEQLFSPSRAADQFIAGAPRINPLAPWPSSGHSHGRARESWASSSLLRRSAPASTRASTCTPGFHEALPYDSSPFKWHLSHEMDKDTTNTKRDLTPHTGRTSMGRWRAFESISNSGSPPHWPERDILAAGPMPRLFEGSCARNEGNFNTLDVGIEVALDDPCDLLTRLMLKMSGTFILLPYNIIYYIYI